MIGPHISRGFVTWYPNSIVPYGLRTIFRFANIEWLFSARIFSRLQGRGSLSFRLRSTVVTTIFKPVKW